MVAAVDLTKLDYSFLFLFYSILFYSILFYSILFYSILFYSILFYSIPIISLFYIIALEISTHICPCTILKCSNFHFRISSWTGYS